MNATAYPQQGWSAPPVPSSQPEWSAPTHPGPKTNLMAILAIGAGAAGATVLLGLGSVAAIVLGFIALSQIKRTGDDGRLLAISAIALGIVTLLALLASVVLGVVAFAAIIEQMPDISGF